MYQNKNELFNSLLLSSFFICYRFQYLCTLNSFDYFVILWKKITLEFSSLKVPSPPTQTPVSEKKVKSAPKGKPIQLVEVQEMFELEDLNKAWDDTFLPKKFYVWVPNPRRKQKQEQA